METERLKLSTLAAATIAVVLIEIIARSVVAAAPTLTLMITGAARFVIIFTLLALTIKVYTCLDPIGLAPTRLWTGAKKGIIWAICFGIVVAIGFAACHLAGINPFMLVKVPLPNTTIATFGYFVVGSGLAPIAEEIYFRGIIFGYLRRWGPLAAIVGSTLLFVAAHPNLQQIPIPQLIGGFVFAISYEMEKNLMVPIVIHSTGNFALFSLSLMG